MDIFSELKKRADREIEGLREASAKTDDANEKYRYRKIRIGIEAMLEHIYEVEEEYKKQTVKTWGDKIRSMSDEELAEFLEKFEVCSHCEYMDKERCTLDNPCVHSLAVAMALKWLQSEIK